MNNKPTSNPFLTWSHRAVVDALWDNMVHTQNPHYGDFRKNTGGYLEGSQWKPIQLLRSSVSKTQNLPNKGYNNKGEVVKADHNNNTFDKSYDFDGIGNRKSATDATGVTNYASNSLNQYSSITNPQSAITNSSHDADGNSLSGVVGTQGQLGEIKWNGNNRLTEVEVAATDGSPATAGTIKVDYDHMGRSFRKSVTTGGETKNSYFIYSGYNAIAKYTANPQSAITLQKSYYWGPDLDEMEDGTGGLLAQHQFTNDGTTSTVETLFALFDGNGNVTDYLKSDGTMAAHFEYSAFGQELVATGDKAATVDHGFSTRIRDREIGMLVYNYRYFNAVDGRWLSRDPIEEQGGFNYYNFVNNNSINEFDYLGHRPAAAGDLEGDKNVYVRPDNFSFNDIDLELYYVDGVGSEIKVLSWDVDDVSDIRTVADRFFLRPDADDVTIEIGNVKAKKLLKKLIKSPHWAIVDGFKAAIQARAFGLNGNWFIEVEYDFFYKYERCEEELFGTDLVWDWDALETEYRNAEVILGSRNFAQGNVVQANDPESIKRMKAALSLTQGVGSKMYAEAIRLVK